MPGMASEDPGLGTGEKTPTDLPIESPDALLEGEHLPGEFSDDPAGDALSREGDTLGLRRGERLAGDALGSLDATLVEKAAKAREARTALTAAGVW
jgi:hypothetical protein